VQSPPHDVTPRTAAHIHTPLAETDVCCLSRCVLAVWRDTLDGLHPCWLLDWHRLAAAHGGWTTLAMKRVRGSSFCLLCPAAAKVTVQPQLFVPSCAARQTPTVHPGTRCFDCLCRRGVVDRTPLHLCLTHRHRRCFATRWMLHQRGSVRTDMPGWHQLTAAIYWLIFGDFALRS